ncbi:kelch-like protein [Corallococcus sp. AB011P]|uniref:Kelch repeat-containing protein n=1 Tax=Corallococcus sp. AB011P TaxID=2316735 RepID=UPI000EA314B5|nr:kelch repeat-containing protein [Corallococcus sp. AB011P]RKG54892.1 kelch-like protein [Corallococcus sp. AB011P]
MQDIWKRRGLFLLLGLWAVLAGCGSEPSTGSAQLVAMVQGAVGAESITQVTVSVTAPDMAAISGALAKGEDGNWSGTLAAIPVGSLRLFTAQAFDASGVKRFEGQAQDVTISGGQPAAVALTLQPVTKPPPFDNTVPGIHSIIASVSTVAPGGTVQLTASVSDNAVGTLTYAWSAQAGTFSAPTQVATSWTAPDTEGPVSFTFTVTDSHGASASISFTLTVTSGQGSAVLTASLNTWPQVTNISASRSQVEVFEPTELTATVTESDGDPLSYAWTAACPGEWTNATSATATFIPHERPVYNEPACGRCPVTVSVTDGRGGVAKGTLRLCIGSPRPLLFRPEIVSTSPAAASVPVLPAMTFRVTARDGQNSPLTFTWTAGAGTLGTPIHTSTTSEVPWTSPSCLAWGQQPLITVSVRNGLGLTTSTQFALTGLAECGPMGWSSTAHMAFARLKHTATVLQDGRVLVAGGFNNSTPTKDALASAEIYDPVTGTWQPTGGMVVPRTQHTATLLPDGRVLVTGGQLVANSTTNSLASAELYDPETGTWTVAASMGAARDYHYALLLETGRVLVLGGEQWLGGNRTKLASAELYDVATNKWLPTGSLTIPRYFAAASLLPSGQVLVSGGESPTGGYSATAELYTPSTGTWRPTGSMAVSRRFHAQTTLPDGRVLVTSGYGSPSGTGWTTTAELYTPATGQWSSAGNLAFGRVDHTATVLPSGRVLIAGGFAYITNGSYHTNIAEIFDPALGTWTRTANMLIQRQGHSATLLSTGKVLVAGGYYGATYSSAELYTE